MENMQIKIIVTHRNGKRKILWYEELHVGFEKWWDPDIKKDEWQLEINDCFVWKTAESIEVI